MRIVTVSIPPSVNRLYSRRAGGQVFKSNEAKIYAEKVAWTCIAAKIPKHTGDVCVTLRCFFRDNRRDIDNVLKCCLDSLQGYAFVNDKQVSELHCFKFIDKENPRIEIEVISL